MTCDYVALAAPGVQKLSPYQPGKPIDELKRELGLSDIVKLASNENPLGVSPRVKEAIARELNELARYPDGNGFVLKDALAQHYGVMHNQITLGNGSNDVLEIIARAFLTPDDDAVYSQHAFAVYPLVVQAIGARGIEVPAKNFGHDLEAMAAAITPKTKIVFVANPNNPTGTAFDHKVLARFLASIPESVIVVLDEAYVEYVGDNEFPDGMEYLPEHRNLIVSRTFSKAYGLASLRVGYSISHPDITNVLNRVRQPFNVNSLALVAAAAALQDQDFVYRTRQINEQGMKQLEAAFVQLGLEWIPSSGNFVCVKLPRPGATIFNELLREGVITRPVANYGMPDYLRVSIGLPEENERFVAALKKVLG